MGDPSLNSMLTAQSNSIYHLIDAVQSIIDNVQKLVNNIPLEDNGEQDNNEINPLLDYVIDDLYCISSQLEALNLYINQLLLSTEDNKININENSEEEANMLYNSANIEQIVEVENTANEAENSNVDELIFDLNFKEVNATQNIPQELNDIIDDEHTESALITNLNTQQKQEEQVELTEATYFEEMNVFETSSKELSNIINNVLEQ